MLANQSRINKLGYRNFMKTITASHGVGIVEEKIYRDLLQCDLMSVFKEHHNPSVNPFYEDRADRNRFAAEQLKQGGHVRNVLNLGGGGKRHLKQSLGSEDISVYEIDLQGDCDLRVNIDELNELPFGDNSFDVVCAFDVLEHLEKFHLINEEMYRVAKDYVLISLPNSATEIFYSVFWNRPQVQADLDRGTFSKFYGLPVVPPSDRHRWWLYFQDIVRFYYCFSLKHKAKLEFWTPKASVKKRAFKAVFGSHVYHTFFCQTVWVKIYKN